MTPTQQEIEKIVEEFDASFEEGLYEPNVAKTCWTRVDDEVRDFLFTALTTALEDRNQEILEKIEKIIDQTNNYEELVNALSKLTKDSKGE